MSEQSTSASLPLYAQVETALAASISEGDLAPGMQLPPEADLMERFGVSRITVRRAIQNLASRGLVEIRRGRGTFATEPKLTHELSALSGFGEDMEALGRNATARVVSKQLDTADRTVARELALSVGSLVVRIERVRLGDGVPISFDVTWLPFEIGQPILSDNLEAEPIFRLLEDKYKVPLMEAEYRLEAVAAEPAVAQALDVPAASPIFLIERTSYTTGNRPIDYERLHYRGDLVKFRTRLARGGKGLGVRG
jgi:GntR family transcriptional regulator